jgi:hypothetical protein
MLAENAMKRAAITVAVGRDKGAAFESPPSVLLAVALGAASLRASADGAREHVKHFSGTPSGEGEATNVRAALLSLIPAAFVTLLIQAALAFQKYRFGNGLTLGTALAAVNWYEATARRKGLPASRVTLFLVATSAAALTLVLQQAACVFATGFPNPSRIRDSSYVDSDHFSRFKWAMST